MRPSIGEVESGISAERVLRSPRRANWSSRTVPVLSSQLDRRPLPTAWASRANGFQNDGPVKAASTRGESASIADRCSGSLLWILSIRRSSAWRRCHSQR